MGQFSPTVIPNWGEQLGQALQGSVGTFLQMRRQRMEDERDMYGRGLMRVDKNAPQPAAQPVAQPFDPSANPAGTIQQGVAPMTESAATGAPAPTYTPNFKGRPGAGQPSVDPALLHAALMQHVQSGAPLQSPQAAAQPQPEASPDIYDQPVHLMGRDWQMTPQAKYQMVLARALQAAEIRQKDAQTFKDTREGGQARPGDANWADVQGSVEGAKALATLPVELQKMVSQHQLSLQEGLALGRQRGAIEAGNIGLRGQIEQQLQGQGQDFQMGQQRRTQDFERSQLPIKLAGEQENRLAGIKYTQEGQIIPSLVRNAKRVLGDGRPTPGSQPLPSAKGRPKAGSPFADLVPAGTP